MAEDTVPLRNEVPPEYTWNAPSVFESPEAWEMAFEQAAAQLDDLRTFQGHLGDGPAVLLEAVGALEALMRAVGKVTFYAYMSHQVDTTDQVAMRMYSRSQGLAGRARAVSGFVGPELLSVGAETLGRWMQEEPRLAVYEHYVSNLFRRQAHVRSAEVEELLGRVSDPFFGPQTIAGALTNADFKFPEAKTEDGRSLPVTQGTFEQILAGADREARRTAWEGYTGTYLAFKNTLASTLTTSIKQNVFTTQARRYPSTLEGALSRHNIPVEVFHNLIRTFRENLPTWHRYWAVRRKALGVETLQPYDIWAPLTTDAPRVSYRQAVDWICQGLAPMGEAYVDTVRQGCLAQRWVDVYPNQGKSDGAFSFGSPGTYPFILMSFDDTLFSLSTLAHELGHSMHSYLTWQTQPMVYTDYSLFVAEVASNFHQALVRAYLLEHNPDPVFQISLIEEAMSNFHRYFFIMPTLARFELETHQRIERGQGLTADDMNDLMADLFSEGYGGQMHVDRPRVGITWATFTHLYVDYYVYQYATGISGAHALAHRILSGEEGALDDYLAFLKAGGSMYPLDVLKRAGVDLTTPEPVEAAFEVLSGMVDRLESLLDSRQ